jgi:hypothetical protein
MRKIFPSTLPSSALRKSMNRPAFMRTSCIRKRSSPLGEIAETMLTVLRSPVVTTTGVCPGRRPRGPSVVVGPHAGLVLEENAGALFGGKPPDLRISCFLPFLDQFRILLIGAVQLHPISRPYQVAVDLVGPQPEIKRQLPLIAAGDDCVQIRQLRRAQPGGRPWRLLRPSAPGPP